jgi:hypothetical protein
MNPVYKVPSYFFKSYFKLFSPVFQWRLFPADFPSIILMHFSSPHSLLYMPHTHPTLSSLIWSS